MSSRTWSRKSLALCLAVAVLSIYSMVVLATPGLRPAGQLSVSGQVAINGQNAISGTTIFSNTSINTAANSSAVVSLGKLGRTELMPSSSLRLTFDESNVAGMLDAGLVRVSAPAGVSATITTKDGVAVTRGNEATVFTVDTSAGNTVVSTQTGLVELRAGDKVQQLAAGKVGMAGTALPGTRPAAGEDEGLSGGALAALLLAAGGAIAAAIIVGTSENNNIDIGGGTTVISPTK